MNFITTYSKILFLFPLFLALIFTSNSCFSQVLEIKGNNISIANNDTSPSLADFTDFGTIPSGTKLVRSFIVKNSGTSNLTFDTTIASRLVLSGTNADQFKINVGVGLETNALILAPNTYVIVDISFNPTSTGLKTATLTFGSTNLGDSTYSFSIQGTASPAVAPTFTRTTLATTLNYPYAVIYGPDNYLWTIERVGKKVNRINKTSGIVDEILDLTSVVYQSAFQDGLMGITLHPKLGIGAGEINQVFLAYTYSTVGKTTFTYSSPSNATERAVNAADDATRRMKIVRYDYNVVSNDGQLSNPVTVLEGLTANNDHNSAKLVFGPDNKLYYTVGDHGSNQGNVNNRCSLVRSQLIPTLAMLNSSPPDYSNYQGKSLRINLDGSIPDDNPVISGIRSHIFSYGHRNASGLAFGKNGKLYSSEHGPKVDDEINILQAGKNYGWPHISGYNDNKNYKYFSLNQDYGLAGYSSCSTIPTANDNIDKITAQYGQLESSWAGTSTDPITTWASTIEDGFNSTNGVYTWPTIAPSNVKIYEGFTAEIPGWNNSILTTTLKNGRVYRQKLSPDGNSIIGESEELFETLNRYRDIAIDPDGKTFYIITDSGGATSAVTVGTTTLPVEDPGKILVFTYNPATTICTTPIVDNNTLPTIISNCSVASLTAPTATNNCAGAGGIVGITDTIFPITTQGNNTVVWKYNYGNGQVVTQNQTVTINSTTWDGATWSNGFPTNQAAIITADYTISAPLSACSLTVTNNAIVSVTSGINVTLSGPLNVSSGSFILNNDAHLIQTTNAINSGNSIVRRNSSPLMLYDYTLWSSPVNNQKLTDFSPLTTTDRFYIYNTNTNLYNAVSNPAMTDFGDGKGYLIRMPNTHPTSPTVWNGFFDGVPHNGYYSIAIANDGATKRFNLVGNPYPSPIDMNQFVADNNTKITGALYFWRKTNGTGSAYCTWAGGTFVTNGNAQTVNPNGIIQTGQGFFVEALNTATSLQFNNNQRVANTTGQFFKTKQPISNRSTIWLNATNSLGNFSQMAIAYIPDASLDVDSYDGKYYNDSAFALNSLLNNEEYIIQSRTAFETSDVVPLVFKTPTAGNYTIAIDHFEGIFNTSQDIILVDSTNKTETDLKAGGYSFTAETGVDKTRFSLKYQKTLSTKESTLNQNWISVFKSKGSISVQSIDTDIKNIKIYDTLGRLLIEKDDINTNEATMDCSKLSNQILIVIVTGIDNKMATKKVVN